MSIKKDWVRKHPDLIKSKKELEAAEAVEIAWNPDPKKYRVEVKTHEQHVDALRDRLDKLERELEARFDSGMAAATVAEAKLIAE